MIPGQHLCVLVITHKNQFLESLGVDAVDADHAITMTQIPHYFGITPIKTDLRCVQRNLTNCSTEAARGI